MFTFAHEFLLYFIVLYLHSTEITVPLKNILSLFLGGCIFSDCLPEETFCDYKERKKGIYRQLDFVSSKLITCTAVIEGILLLRSKALAAMPQNVKQEE